MRTLSEIIEAAKSDSVVSPVELQYAVCTLDALMTFDRMAFSKLAHTEREGKKPRLSGSAVFQHSENFNRVKRALGKSPRDWLGQENDPQNPSYQERRKKSNDLFDRLLNITTG